MSVQSEIDRIITAVGNAYSKVSEKGGTVPASQTVANLATAIDSIPSGAAKETWVIKSSATGVFATTQISFTSNGQKFTSIGANDSSGFATILYYDNNEIAGYDPNSPAVYDFDDDGYRKLTFDTPPTGALLTWLQSNATKQPDNTAVQDTKAVTITSNGTVSVTPDAPYDALKKVDVTVDVSGGEDVIIKRVTFNPSSNYLLSNDKCVITHNCGKIPKAVFIFSDNTNQTYLGYGYIFNFSGSNDTTNVSMYTTFGISDDTYRVAFTTTTMKFTLDSDKRYKSGKHYYFTFVC